MASKISVLTADLSIEWHIRCWRECFLLESDAHTAGVAWQGTWTAGIRNRRHLYCGWRNQSTNIRWRILRERPRSACVVFESFRYERIRGLLFLQPRSNLAPAPTRQRYRQVRLLAAPVRNSPFCRLLSAACPHIHGPYQPVLINSGAAAARQHSCAAAIPPQVPEDFRTAC